MCPGGGYAIRGTRPPGFVRIVIFGETTLVVALDLRAEGAVDREMEEFASSGDCTLPDDNPKFFGFSCTCGGGWPVKAFVVDAPRLSTIPNSHLADSLSPSPNIRANKRALLDNTWLTSLNRSWQNSPWSLMAAWARNTP